MLERLQADVKQAMKAGDALTRDTLRMVVAELKKREVDEGRALDEAEQLAVLHRAVKTREEAATQYDSAGRADLATRERAELEVIRRYLPQVLSEEEARSLVRTTIEALGASGKQDLGRVMKAVMAEHRGRVDGKVVQRLAAELLA